MTVIRIIIVGVGARAQAWMKIIASNPEFEVVGICDPDKVALDRAAAIFPDATTGAVISDIISTDAQAALLCTPPSTRHEQITLCCANKIHILTEKPLADSFSGATNYVTLADNAGIHLIVGLNFRYQTVTQKTRQLFQDQIVGSPEFARFTYERWRDGRQSHLNTYPLTMSHPMLWEQSIHHFDQMRFVYSAEPTRVYARTFNPSWTMYKDDTNVSAVIDFDNGITVNYQGTWQGNHDVLDFEWRTDCTHGIVVQSDMFGELAFALRDDKHLTDVSFEPDEPMITDTIRLLAGFADTLMGRATPECTGRDHLKSLSIVEACILSSKRKNAVEISEIIETSSAAE